MRKKYIHLGFTLIELLLVVAIISLLSAVVLASLITARAKGRDAQRISDIKQLRNALQLYTNDHGGTYPTLLTTLDPTYIHPVPTDPLQDPLNPSLCRQATASSNGYCYAYYPATPTFYHLGAMLELDNPVLKTDANCNSGSSLNPAWTKCPPVNPYSNLSGFAGYSGVNALLYNVLVP